MDIDLITEIRSLQQQIADLKNDPNGTQMSSPVLAEALGELTATLNRYGRDIGERQHVERALRQRTHQLGERVKELSCLYGISALVERPGITLPEILQGTVDLIPPSWQFPDITAARVLLEGQEFKTADFPETAVWLQAADISIHGQRCGVVQVCYLEAMPESDEGPFLKEERDLINGIAERLGRTVERVRAEEGQREALTEALKIRDALRESEERFRVALEDSRIVVYNQDRDLRYTWIYNPQLGYTPAGILGKTDGELLLPEDAAVLDKIKRQVLESGVLARETVRTIIDGQSHFYDLTVEPLRDETGDIIGVTGASMDITERTRTAELLREQNQLINTVFESLAHPFYVIDANDYTIKMANSAAYRGELPGTVTCYALTHRRDSPCSDRGLACPLLRIKQTKQPAVVEHTHFDRRGEQRFFEVRGHPIFDENGQVTQIIEYTLDITERRRTQDVLQETTQLLETILDHTTMAVAYLDTQFNFIRVNRAYARVDEREPSFFPGKNHFDLVPDAESETIFRRVVETGEPYLAYARRFEYPEHPERGVSYWDWSLVPIQDAAGTATGLVLSLMDVTKRKQAEQGAAQAAHALRESEKKYRQLFELAQEGLWVIDADAKTTLVNPRMAEMLGYSAQEMLGKHLYSFMDDAGVAITERNLERRRQGIKEQHDFEFLRKDGTRIYTILETTPFFDDDGAYAGGLAMVADITERRRAEVALRQAHNELETRVQERTAALEAANRALQAEIAEREQAEEELRASEELLEQRVNERTRQLATLLEISRNVALTPKLEPLLDLILDRLKSVVDYDDATIFKLEEDELIAMAHRGLVPQEDIMPQRYSLEHAPFGRELILNRQTVIIPDVRADSALAREFRHVTGERFETLYGQVRTWMAVPLTIKDTVVGVLTLKHGEPDYYASSLTELVRGFGDQAAVAIENTRLYEQAQTLAALEERQRLARDLHDAVSQTLFSASLAAEVLPRLWESKPDEGRQCLTELRQLTRGALAEMRTLLLELRPSALMEVGLGDLLRQLGEAAGSRARVPVDVTYEGQCALEPEVQIAFYRIAQEALSNIVKHAGASRATVALRCSSHSPSASAARARATGTVVELQIEDDGCGFEPARVPVESLGLTIMRERAAAIGAEFEIGSQVGRGSHVRVVWPGIKENVP
jgi:two-component system nitrate/nitrite sensor histidine kinase NarX